MLPHPARSCRLFLFDLDGTLIDSQEDIVRSLNMALRRMRFTAIAPARIGSFVGDGIQKLIERALTESTGRSPDPEETGHGLELFQEEYGRHLLDHTHLYPGAGEALERLHWARCAVVSNKPADFCRRILAGLGVSGRFEVILGGDSTRNRKPHPEPLLEAMRFCRVTASESVMVGDSLVDIEAGRAAGVVTCGVLGGFRPEDELKSAGCDLLIRSLAELSDHFQSPA